MLDRCLLGYHTAFIFAAAFTWACTLSTQPYSSIPPPPEPSPFYHHHHSEISVSHTQPNNSPRSQPVFGDISRESAPCPKKCLGISAFIQHDLTFRAYGPKNVSLFLSVTSWTKRKGEVSRCLSPCRQWRTPGIKKYYHPLKQSISLSVKGIPHDRI